MSERKRLNLVAIGFGGRLAGFFNRLCKADPDARLGAIVDPDRELPMKRLADFGLADHQPTQFDDIDQWLPHAGDFDGAMIGTNCHLHTPLAVKIAATGLPLFLEKPVAVDWARLEQLSRAWEGREKRVVVSFPMRLTPHTITAMEIIRSGRLGPINQVQAVNNVPYGGCYYHKKIRNHDSSGGLWLQKATHDFDYINMMLDSRPERITAMHSRKVYGGDLPDDLECRDCDQQRTCPESPQNIERRPTTGGVPAESHPCMFRHEIKHQDSGSAIIMYRSGVHANYTQNFVARRGGHSRGATVIGYEATMKFDYAGDYATVSYHHCHRDDHIQLATLGGHAGGDHGLACNFLDIVRGEDESHADLHAGLLSAAMCLAARDSAWDGGSAMSIPEIGPDFAGDIERRRRGEPHIRGEVIEPPTDTRRL